VAQLLEDVEAADFLGSIELPAAPGAVVVKIVGSQALAELVVPALGPGKVVGEDPLHHAILLRYSRIRHDRPSRRGPGALVGLVRRAQARSSLARIARSLRHLGQRGDAAADAGADRRPLLAALHRALSHRRGPGRRAAVRGALAVARSGVLRQGPK